MHRNYSQLAASLSFLGLVLLGCSHDWDAYDPGINGAIAGAGGVGAGGAGVGGTGVGAGGAGGAGAGGAGVGGVGGVGGAGGGVGGTGGTVGQGGAGGITCGTGLTLCQGNCVDTDIDPANCGMCDHACSPTEACFAGMCAVICGPGETNCNGQCFDTTSDVQHCGSCAIACGPGATCGASQCVCTAPQTYCGGSLGCIDTSSDVSNCGACMAACGSNEMCVSGGCECTPVACGVCSIQDLGSSVPQSTSGNTVGVNDDIDVSCVPPGAGEVVFEFTAPSDAVYTLDLFGSDYDAALGVLDMGCGQIACNDDAYTVDSRVSVFLSQNQSVYVVVDGFNGLEGNFDLHINYATCPAADLGSTVPQTVNESTEGMPDFIGPSCTGSGSPEYTYIFTAPMDGTYTFDTIPSDFDTALHIHDGGCWGPELACDDDSGGNGQSAISLFLVGGQAVVIAVDGAGGDEGDYTLNININ